MILIIVMMFVRVMACVRPPEMAERARSICAAAPKIPIIADAGTICLSLSLSLSHTGDESCRLRIGVLNPTWDASVGQTGISLNLVAVGSRPPVSKNKLGAIKSNT